MAYTKQEWKNRQVERPNTYTRTENGDGSVTLHPAPGTVMIEGTPLSAQRMNHMEDGIEAAEIHAGEAMSKANENSTELDALSLRVDLIASLEEGSTTGDAELQDIRAGYNGQEYASAGSAVRGQVRELHEDLGAVESALDMTICRQYLRASAKESGKYWNVSGGEVITSSSDDYGRFAKISGLKAGQYSYKSLVRGYTVIEYGDGTLVKLNTLSGADDNSGGTVTVPYDFNLYASYQAAATYSAWTEGPVYPSESGTEGVWKAGSARLDTIEAKLGEENDPGSSELYTGELVNGHLTASGVVDDTYTNYRLSMTDVVALPRTAGRKLTVRIGEEYLIAFRFGAVGNNLDISTDWLADGDTVTPPAGANYYAATVCNAAGTSSHKVTTISPLEDIGLTVTCPGAGDAMQDNADAAKLLESARRVVKAGDATGCGKLPVLAHTSDPHGDYERVRRFFTFCDGAGVDVACVTGDITAYSPLTGWSWFQALVNSAETVPAVCPGNHDVAQAAVTDAVLYEKFFAPILDKIGMSEQTPGSEATWYFRDIDGAKLRLISVNLYEYGGTQRSYTHFSDTQLAWLADALENTPAGYGVVILSHAPQTIPEKENDYAVFWQDVRKANSTMNPVDGCPVYDLVDAFIARGTLNKTYTQTGDPGTVTVSADFTNVAEGAEFIAHLTGHFHQDSIGYVPGTEEKQLQLNVVCTIPHVGGTPYPYLADLCDIGRNPDTAAQDAFNLYVIDRENQAVKVIRAGSSWTDALTERRVMTIPYA